MAESDEELLDNISTHEYSDNTEVLNEYDEIELLKFDEELDYDEEEVDDNTNNATTSNTFVDTDDGNPMISLEIPDFYDVDDAKVSIDDAKTGWDDGDVRRAQNVNGVGLVEKNAADIITPRMDSMKDNTITTTKEDFQISSDDEDAAGGDEDEGDEENEAGRHRNRFSSERTSLAVARKNSNLKIPDHLELNAESRNELSKFSQQQLNKNNAHFNKNNNKFNNFRNNMPNNNFQNRHNMPINNFHNKNNLPNINNSILGYPNKDLLHQQHPPHFLNMVQQQHWHQQKQQQFLHQQYMQNMQKRQPHIPQHLQQQHLQHQHLQHQRGDKDLFKTMAGSAVNIMMKGGSIKQHMLQQQFKQHQQMPSQLTHNMKAQQFKPTPKQQNTPNSSTHQQAPRLNHSQSNLPIHKSPPRYNKPPQQLQAQPQQQQHTRAAFSSHHSKLTPQQSQQLPLHLSQQIPQQQPQQQSQKITRQPFPPLPHPPQPPLVIHSRSQFMSRPSYEEISEGLPQQIPRQQFAHQQLPLQMQQIPHSQLTQQPPLLQPQLVLQNVPFGIQHQHSSFMPHDNIPTQRHLSNTQPSQHLSNTQPSQHFPNSLSSLPQTITNHPTNQVLSNQSIQNEVGQPIQTIILNRSRESFNPSHNSRMSENKELVSPPLNQHPNPKQHQQQQYHKHNHQQQPSTSPNKPQPDKSQQQQKMLERAKRFANPPPIPNKNASASNITNPSPIKKPRIVTDVVTMDGVDYVAMENSACGDGLEKNQLLRRKVIDKSQLLQHQFSQQKQAQQPQQQQQRDDHFKDYELLKGLDDQKKVRENIMRRKEERRLMLAMKKQSAGIPMPISASPQIIHQQQLPQPQQHVQTYNDKQQKVPKQQPHNNNKASQKISTGLRKSGNNNNIDFKTDTTTTNTHNNNNNNMEDSSGSGLAPFTRTVIAHNDDSTDKDASKLLDFNTSSSSKEPSLSALNTKNNTPFNPQTPASKCLITKKSPLSTQQVAVSTGAQISHKNVVNTSANNSTNNISNANINNYNNNNKTVIVHNLKADNNSQQLKKFAELVGPLQSLQMATNKGKAVLKFKQSTHAWLFTKAFHRKNIGNALVSVTLY